MRLVSEELYQHSLAALLMHPKVSAFRKTREQLGD